MNGEIILRIIYNYIFDATKVMKREEVLPCVLEFIQRNALIYEDLLFKLSTYKDSNAKRKTYFEKLCEKDAFWRKYRVKYQSDIAKETFVDGVSNLKEGKWIKRKIDERDAHKVVLDKLGEQLKAMPKYSYEIVFNDISWFPEAVFGKPLMVPGTTEVYPLSSNITIMKYYPEKIYIALNFEMCSAYTNHKMYVDDFSKQIGCAYLKEIQFVKDEVEREEYSRAYLQANKILRQIEYTKVNIDSSSNQAVENLYIKKILKKVFGTEVKLEGGIYEICKIDKYRNKISIHFDYDKQLRSLSAVLIYMGMGFKYVVHYSEIKPLLCDDSVKQYAEKVYSEAERFISKYVPLIIGYYEPLPEWFEW